MIQFEYISNEIYIYILFLALFVFILSKINQNYLTIIIISILITFYAYLYFKQLIEDKTNNLKYKENKLEDDIKERLETNEKIFYIDVFPKNVKYLKKNNELIDIITNLRFIIKFNKTIYSDIILNMNKLMKIYIYILSNRYDIVQYIPIFIDIRDNIIELLYSLFIIIPDKMKHTYGVNTYNEIYNSTYGFIIYSRKMLEILENYGKINNKIVYIPDTKYKPYNSLSDSYFH